MSETTTNTVKCPNCGANATTPRGRDRFACDYCGATITVEKKAAAVAAAATERTAAEMALTRLKQELAAATAERDRYLAETSVQLGSYDEQLEALGRRQGGFRVVLDTVGIAMPMLIWAMFGDDAPVFLVLLALVVGWWLARNHWKIAGTISGFTWAWSITYTVGMLSAMPFCDLTKGPPGWLIPTVIVAAIPVALGWTVLRNRSRAKKRDAQRALVLASRAECVAKRETGASDARAKVAHLEDRIAENRARADA